jgi:hypothetical protein
MTPAGWSLGVYIGLPVTVVVALVCIGWIWFWLAGPSEGHSVSLFGLIALAAALAVAGIAYWPWDPSFHRWYHVEGTVTAVASRTISDDNHMMNQRFVVLIDGRSYGVDDTRAALLRGGDHVSLMCKKEWAYRAKFGWVCNWD